MYNFYEQAPYLFYQAALGATMAHARGIVLDLRNNPGGYLDAAVSVSGWFVSKGKTIVTEEFRDKNKNETFTSSGPSIFDKTPIVVIINKGSASASEIVAGALKESNDAIIVGEKSFGKGTVQELVALQDGSMIKITIAHWLTPNGNQIDKNGIIPDIAIADAETQSTSTAIKSDYNNDLNNDVIFQKAIQIIDKKL
jgi:carboxyl-terminal processing protease